MKTFLKAAMAAILVSLSATAFAQCIPMNAPGPPRLWDGVRGCYVPQGTPALAVGQPMVQGQIIQQQVQLIPVQGQPGMFTFGGNQHRCPALTGWTGGVIGLVVGAAIGNNSTLNGQKLTLPGAAAGALAGTQIACESVRPNVVAHVPPQGQHSGSGFGSHGSYGGEQHSSARGVFCNIDGVVTKEADTPTCEAKARQKAEGLVTGKASQVMSQGHAPVCGTGKTWGRLNWQGHPQHNTFACLPGDAPRFQE